MRKFWTVGEIDATGVRGPHEMELQNISNAKHTLFIDLGKEKLAKLVKDELGGLIENIGLNEDWTLTIEMFPEVNIHFVYSYFGDEFGGDPVAEFKFLFSGKHATWVPGEDSATYIDIIMDLIERKLKNEEPFEQKYIKTELMNKVLLQRNQPFALLVEDDKNLLSEFLGAKVWRTTNGWKIKKELLPDIYAELTWHEENGLDINFSGDKLRSNIGNYHVEFLGIFLINHVLRYITLHNLDKNLADICYIMFSRMYTKEKNWTHRRT